METPNITLTPEQAQKLQYINLKTKQNIQDSIDIVINLYFEQIQQQKDPLARLKQSPLIASFHGDSNLSENAEAIVHALQKKSMIIADTGFFIALFNLEFRLTE